MPAPRARNVSRQKEAGAAARAETRHRLLDSAAREFAALGYARSTVARIAAGAGVTVQTLYLAWGSKRALLRAYLERQLSGTDDEPPVGTDLSEVTVSRQHAEGDPRTVVIEIAALYGQVVERTALAWQLYRDAAATDPEIAEDWAVLQHLRHNTFAQLVARIPVRALRDGLTASTAADTAWAVASPETYDLLVRRADYTHDQYRDWVRDTLMAVLLSDRAADSGS